jgi:hypothetical protein
MNQPRRHLQRHATGLRHGAVKVGRAHEVGHEGAGRLVVQRPGRAHLFDAALVHQHDAVGQALRLFLVVRDHQRGQAQPRLQLAQLAAQPRAHLGVQRRQRLVQQQQRRRQRQRTRQRNPLLLAAGQLAGELLLVSLQRQQRSGRPPCLSDLGRGLRWLTSPKATLSATVRLGNSAYDWNTMPTSRCDGGRPSMATPCLKICPLLACSRPARHSSSVVLPQPDGPRKQTNSPLSMLERHATQHRRGAEQLAQRAHLEVGRGFIRPGCGRCLRRLHFFGSVLAS